MKLIKFYTIIALVLSTSAFAGTSTGGSCFDITAFPTVEKTIKGKVYNFPKCEAACPNMTPYTHPRCIDYDHVFPTRKLPGNPKPPVVPPVTP